LVHQEIAPVADVTILGQPAIAASNRQPCYITIKPVFRSKTDSVLGRQVVDAPETGIVTGSRIIRAWITQAHD